MTGKMHAALASDDNYFCGLLTAVAGMVEFCSVPENLVVHVLDGGIAEENWLKLDGVCASRGARIVRHSVDQSRFSGLESWHGGGRMTYARLLLPELMPDVECVVYSDVDFLWRIDIARLWKKLEPEAAIHCVTLSGSDSEVFRPEIEWLAARKRQFDRSGYFCAGFLVMNLQKFRDEGLHLKALEFLETAGGNAPFVDQTALNWLFAGRRDVVPLPGVWQTISSEKDLLGPSCEAAIHYAGDCPWKQLARTNHLLTDMHILWHRTYADIAGMTLWQSLRRGNSAPMIVLCRTLYLLICHSRLFKALIRAWLLIMGRDAGFLNDVFRVKCALRIATKPLRGSL